MAQALAPLPAAAAAEADELAAQGDGLRTRGGDASQQAGRVKEEAGGPQGAPTAGAGFGGAPAISEEVADMAAEWAGLLAAGPASGAAATYGMAGMAAAVLVCACPRRGSV